MSDRIAVVVTSISQPSDILHAIARGCIRASWDFYLVGDDNSPKEFVIDGCQFFGVKEQLATGLEIANSCPRNHYARKNIGYLVAIKAGASVIVETDDDNIPIDEFWSMRVRVSEASAIDRAGWVNPYGYFTNVLAWPRGLPLSVIHRAMPAFEALPRRRRDCPIQQGLADDHPDVDAVHRLLFPHPITFRRDRRLALGLGSWCPFNSQNTTWWRDVFPLLYLPAYCSFRMTDIWRSFVAQRICWENGWSVMFHEPTVRQDRNAHDLLRDFADEVPGYLNNHKIADILADAILGSGFKAIPENMRICYRALVGAGFMGANEMDLLEVWFSDLARLRII